METVAAHAFGVERVRDCKTVGDIGMTAMECGVETSDLQ